MDMPNRADGIQSVSAVVRQRWVIIGPLLMAAAIIAIEVLSRAGYKVPNPPAILMLLVVFSTFTGGMLVGLISAVFELSHTAYYFSIPGQPFHYTSENLVRVAVWAIAVPAMVFMVGYLHRRAERSAELAARNASLEREASERQRAMEIVLKEKDFSESVINSLPGIFYLFDHTGKFLCWNRHLEYISGYSPEEIARMHPLDLVSLEDRELVGRKIQEAFTKDMVDFEAHLVTREGLQIPNYFTGTRIVIDDVPCLLGMGVDITERKQAESRLSYLAHYDTLTGLPNRVLLTERMKAAMADAHQRERLMAIVFLDLDRFKYINDSLGHEEGDVLLKAVATRLSATVRRGDTAARLSGDEFAFVLADMGHVDDAHFVARKILDAFQQPFRVAGRELHVTASLGITIYPFDERDAQGLLRNADVAMYHAKASGKNNYQFYSVEMTAKATEWLSLENDLRNALPGKELLLHYQPIADCRTGRLLGMEALLRWNHPTRGMISPAQFIPLAEETGLIAPIGEWVLRTACAQCRAWQLQGNESLYVAVNVSARQFQQRNLAASIQEVLQETGLDAASLDLELTEGLIMHQAETTATILRELKAMNIRISIDDFGTGYSSLGYLKRFPIDVLKIDQSFVRDIPGDPDDMAIAGTIITMAHSLGMKVVAEGVETEQQLKFMRENACDAMQGYYLSKPLPAEQFEKFLENGSRLATG
jgi:diguanylate cyclase (GGDEF)-like protein/PAS domain S-box-containing protein